MMYHNDLKVGVVLRALMLVVLAFAATVMAQELTVASVTPISAAVFVDPLTVRLFSTEGGMAVFQFNNDTSAQYNISLVRVFESATFNSTEPNGIPVMIPGSEWRFRPVPWSVSEVKPLQQDQHGLHVNVSTINMNSTIYRNRSVDDEIIVDRAALEYSHTFEVGPRWTFALSVRNYTFVNDNSSAVFVYNFTSTNRNAALRIAGETIFVGSAFYSIEDSRVVYLDVIPWTLYEPIAFRVAARPIVGGALVYVVYEHLPRGISSFAHLVQSAGIAGTPPRLLTGDDDRVTKMEDWQRRKQQEEQKFREMLLRQQMSAMQQEVTERISPLTDQMKALVQGVETATLEQTTPASRAWHRVTSWVTSVWHRIF